MNRMGVWGNGNSIRGIYRYYDEKHKRRMGSCSWLPKDGDLCLCTGHTGDYFNDYVALKKTKGGKYQKHHRFGAYTFGKRLMYIPEKKFHLLLGGMKVDLAIKGD